jgi:type IV pilus assembly protein PilB
MDLKLLTDEQLNHAITGASQSHMKIGQFLVQNGIVEGGQLIDALCQQLKVVKYHPDIYPLDDGLASMIPFEIAEKHQVVPLNKCGRLISLAMVDPMDIKALDSVEGLIDAEVEPVICTETEIAQLINNMYSPRSRIGGVLENEESDTETVDNKIEGENGRDEDVQVTEEMADEPTVVRLVNRILDQAVREGASDIHISPQKDSVQLRFRLDGKLHDMQDLPKTLFQSLVARLKVLSKMDITLTRVPQDGRFTLRVHKKEINVRVSSVPLIYGENMVLRMLDMSAQIY